MDGPSTPVTRDELADRLAAAGRAFLVPEEGLEVEHTRLFLNPLGAPCPPWQSVYEPAEGDVALLLGPAHQSALAWYRRFEVEPAAENEPADHIGLLLLFYARLLAEQVPDETLDEFRRQHLAWIPAFLARVQDETRSEAFRSLAAEVTTLLDLRV